MCQGNFLEILLIFILSKEQEAEAPCNSSAAEYNKAKNAILEYKKASGELISLDTTSAFSK